jgi:hypothetical protein
MEVGPHPHIGLSTVTWLLEGAAVHTDSLGSEQALRPGQLNLMTAGHGIAHAEETPLDEAGPMHGVQFWVAQPEATRHGAPAFEHHGELPVVGVGDLSATVLLGSHAGATSPARADWPTLGLELRLRPGTAEVPVDPTFEHAVVVLDGALQVGDTVLEPGRLGYLEPGETELALRATGDGRALLLGGAPFESEVLMWWNFVARSRDEVDAAAGEWNEGSDRFGEVPSDLERIPSPVPPWRSAPPTPPTADL